MSFRGSAHSRLRAPRRYASTIPELFCADRPRAQWRRDGLAGAVGSSWRRVLTSRLAPRAGVGIAPHTGALPVVAPDTAFLRQKPSTFFLDGVAPGAAGVGMGVVIGHVQGSSTMTWPG